MKKRCDRNHVIYRMSIGDQSYIGLTVANGRAFGKAVKLRVQKHISRAMIEQKDWSICGAIRGAEVVEYEVLEVVRGRKPAHQREREIIAEMAPTLNTF
jgi:hypothetical protein